MRRHVKGTYRSGLEKSIAKDLATRKRAFTYEQEKIKYTVPEKECTYTPDFVIETSSGNKIYIESKGIWDAEDSTFQGSHMEVCRQEDTGGMVR